MNGLTPANRTTHASKTGSGVLILPTVSTVVQPIPPAALFKRSVMILCSSGDYAPINVNPLGGGGGSAGKGWGFDKF